MDAAFPPQNSLFQGCKRPEVISWVVERVATGALQAFPNLLLVLSEHRKAVLYF